MVLCYSISKKQIPVSTGGVLVLECKICRIKLIRALNDMLKILYFILQNKNWMGEKTKLNVELLKVLKRGIA